MRENNDKSKRPYLRSLDGFVVAPKKKPEFKRKKINLDRKVTQKILEKEEKIVQKIPRRIVKEIETIKLEDKKSNVEQKKTKKIFKRTILAVLILIVLVGGYVGFKFFHTIDKVFHGNIISDAQALFSTTPLNGEDKGRVNILLAGDSADDFGHNGGDLTDSIVVLSIDTKNHNAFMLSVPRDLWVYIKGAGYQKINAANVLGTNIPGYPQNGMGRLEYIVSQNLGIPINYYALANYSAFRDAVNAVGGVSVNIQSPDRRGLYDPSIDWSTKGPLVKLTNGVHNLNGQQALDLARARGDAYGSYGFPNADFTRTANQRLLFSAIAQKALSLGVISNPVKIGKLFNSFSNNVQTDMTLKNVLRFVQITKGIDINKVKSYSFCSTMTSGSCPKPIITTYQDSATNASALIPVLGIGNYSDLTNYYLRLTSNNPLALESPTVVILNGTGINGLAKTESDNLTKQGFEVLYIGNTATTYKTSLILDKSSNQKPNSLKYLEDNLTASSVTSTKGNTEAAEGVGYNADFVIVIGQSSKITAQ